LRPSPHSPLCPYTTLFRSNRKIRGCVRGSLDCNGGCFAPSGAYTPAVALDCGARASAAQQGLPETGFHLLKQIAVELERLVKARSEEHTSELQSRENLVCR